MLANVGIERAIIASLCQHNKDALIEIEDIGTSVESFTTTSNQALFSSLKFLIDNTGKVDQALLLITLKDLGYSALFETKKDIEYIGSLFNFPIKVENIREFAIRLEKITIARQAILKHREAIEALQEINGSESIEKIIQLSEDPIFNLVTEINKGKDSGPHLLFENIEELIEELKENKCEAAGVQTPWAIYNSAIGGGLRRGGVNLISARPKKGKSTLGKEAILHFIKNGIPCLLLDTEMVLKDQLIRAVASLSEIQLKDVESGKFSDNYHNEQKIKKVISKYKNDKCFWYEAIHGRSFEEVLAIIRRWIVKNVGYDDNGNVNNCVVVYDYFKLMDKTQLDNLQEYQAMGFQISRLTDFCKEFDFACLAFVQLNRQNDISQSDRLRWLCHSYGAFEEKQPEEIMNDQAENGNRKLTIYDTRFGPGIDDGDYICYNFDRGINKINEICLKSQIGQRQNVEEFEEI